jgi:hypothetical protein
MHCKCSEKNFALLCLRFFATPTCIFNVFNSENFLKLGTLFAYTYLAEIRLVEHQTAPQTSEKNSTDVETLKPLTPTLWADKKFGRMRWKGTGLTRQNTIQLAKQVGNHIDARDQRRRKIQLFPHRRHIRTRPMCNLCRHANALA